MLVLQGSTLAQTPFADSPIVNPIYPGSRLSFYNPANLPLSSNWLSIDYSYHSGSLNRGGGLYISPDIFFLGKGGIILDVNNRGMKNGVFTFLSRNIGGTIIDPIQEQINSSYLWAMKLGFLSLGIGGRAANYYNERTKQTEQIPLADMGLALTPFEGFYFGLSLNSLNLNPTLSDRYAGSQGIASMDIEFGKFGIGGAYGIGSYSTNLARGRAVLSLRFKPTDNLLLSAGYDSNDLYGSIKYQTTNSWGINYTYSYDRYNNISRNTLGGSYFLPTTPPQPEKRVVPKAPGLERVTIIGRPTLTPDGKPLFQKGQVIVKTKPGVIRLPTSRGELTSDELVPISRALIKSSNINQTAQKFRVKEIRHFFKISKTHEQIMKQYPKRAARAPKGVEPPDLTQIYLMKFPEEIDVWDVVEDLNRHEDVVYAEPNVIIYLDLIPNDPYFRTYDEINENTPPNLWNLYKIKAPEAWDIITGSNQVIVAVADSGVDYNHEDIKDNIWINPGEDINRNGGVDNSDFNNRDDDSNDYIDDIRGWNFVGRNNDPMDTLGHGSHVAGIIAAIGNNTKGVVGVTWNSKIMTLNSTPEGGIRYATENGADVINCSWQALDLFNTPRELVEDAYANGVLVVAAAGNFNIDALNISPSAAERAISVANFNYQDRINPTSAHGIKIDVAAPGTDIWSLENQSNDYIKHSGTSMASPHVAGLAALLLAHDESLSPEEIRQIIRKSADDVGEPGWDLSSGYGRINAFKALQTTNACKANITYPTVNVLYFTTWNEPLNLVSGTIQIRGTASGRNFRRYVVQYGIGITPESWNEIGSSNIAVEDGVLINAFDTASLSSGTYTLRLLVENNRGEIYEDRAKIDLKLIAKITNPRNHSYVFSNSLSIEGFAFGANFKSYHLEYRLTSEVEWHPIGEVRYEPSGVDLEKLRVRKSILYDSLDLSQIPDGVIFLKLVVEDTRGNKTEDRITIIKDSTNFPFQRGWPQYLGLEWDSSLSPVVGDVDRDGKLEIFAGTRNYIFGFKADGSILAGWPIVLIGSSKISSSLTLGDVNGDGYSEIAFKSLDDIDNHKEYVNLFKYNGDHLWTKEFNTFDLSSFVAAKAQSTIVFEDMNHDGKLELIFGSYGDSSNRGQVHVLKHDGAYLPGWPQNTAGPVINTPAVGDLDGDGLIEVVASTVPSSQNSSRRNFVYIWRENGNLINTSFPIELPHYSYGYQTILADFNNDGNKEILFWGNFSGVIVYNLNGERLWTTPVPSGWEMVDSAVGDMDNDGNPEYILLLVDNSGRRQGRWFQVEIYKNNGELLARTPSVPIIDCQQRGSIIIGNINEDALNEAIINLMGENKIFAVSKDGLLNDPFWPLNKNSESSYASPVITDLDQDEDVEIISNDFYYLSIWDLPFSYTIPEWGMFKHDRQHTGNYGYLVPETISPPSYFTLTGSVGGGRPDLPKYVNIYTDASMNETNLLTREATPMGQIGFIKIYRAGTYWIKGWQDVNENGRLDNADLFVVRTSPIVITEDLLRIGGTMGVRLTLPNQ